MNRKEKIQQVLQKLELGNPNLTKEELFITKRNSTLKRKFFSLLSTPDLFWNDTTHNLLLDTLDDSDIDILGETFLEKCIILEINRGAIDILEDANSYLSTEKYRQLRQYLDQKLKDPNYTLENSFCRLEDLMQLMRAERYDLLCQAKTYSDVCLTLPATFLAEFKEKYPFSKYPIPQFLYGRISEFLDIYERLQLSDLFILVLQVNEIDSTLAFYIYERLHGEEDLTHLCSKSNDSFDGSLDNFLCFFDDEQKGEIYSLLLEKKSLCFLKFCRSDLTNERYVDQIVEALIANPMNYYYLPAEFFSNEKIIQALVAIGKFDLVVHDPSFAQYIPLIVSRIETDPTYCTELKDTDITAIPEIVRALIKRGQYGFFKPSTYWCSDFKRDIYEQGSLGMYREEILDLIRKGKVVPGIWNLPRNPSSLSADELDFLGVILQSNNMGMLHTCFTKLEQFPPQFLPMLLENLNKDVSVAEQFLKLYGAMIFETPLLLDFYLQVDGFFVEDMIDYIAHHEEMSNRYTDDLYQKVKKYYIEKNHLNETHLDVLEKRFGPQILRYINVDNLIQIVNMEPSNFNRLLNLLGGESFSLTDIEKYYDSLKQYEFSKKNQDVVEIFSNLKHYIEDKNPKYLSLLERLVPVMDERFF